MVKIAIPFVMSVEVFRTNVANPQEAQLVLDNIHSTWTNFRASFDLEDCDRVLRISAPLENISPATVMALLQSLGFTAEVLEA